MNNEWMGLPLQQVILGHLSYFWARSTVQETGCIEWNGFRDKKGYGRMNQSYNGEQLVHRAVYKEFHGKIASDLTIDHLCKNKGCLNVHHMELVTSAENTHRREGNQYTGVLYCIHGHEFTTENTYIHPKRGTRHCRTCAAHRSRKMYA